MSQSSSWTLRGEHAISGTIVVEGYAVSGAFGDELAVSLSRANLVRNYVNTRFGLAGKKHRNHSAAWSASPSHAQEQLNGICIVLLAQR
jgi:hypothetical protein